MLCRKCGNTGATRLNPYRCDACGLESVKVANINVIPMDEKPNIDIATIVPTRYKNRNFDINKLKNSLCKTVNPDGSVRDSETIKRANIYCSCLHSIYNKIASGTTIKQSAYISSSSGNGKRTFAYSLIKEAIKNNISAIPLLDLGDVHRILWGYSVEEMKDYTRGVTSEDIYNADVCVIYVDLVGLKYWFIIQHLLDKRSTLNKATIFISNIPSTVLIEKYRDFETYFFGKTVSKKEYDTQYLLNIHYYEYRNTVIPTYDRTMTDKELFSNIGGK